MLLSRRGHQMFGPGAYNNNTRAPVTNFLRALHAHTDRCVYVYNVYIATQKEVDGVAEQNQRVLV